MAFTLNDYLKVAKTALYAGVIQNLMRYSPLMSLIPFESAQGLKVKALRWKTLPSVAWRDLNEDFGTGTGKTEEVEEALYNIGHSIDIDKLFMRAKDHILDPMELQIDMVTQAVAFEFNDKAINGSPIVDPKAVWGLKYRIGLLPASQTIYLDAAFNGTGAETHIFANDANRALFLDKVSEAIDAVGGAPVTDAKVATVLLMNKKTYQGFRSILRALKLWSTTQDQFGLQVPNYEGARLIDIGLKANQGAEIILNTEDPGDGGADSSSVYAVRLEVGPLGFFGTQLYPLEVNDVGLLESGRAFRTVLDWPIGFMGLSNYYAARVRGFEMAAA